MEYRICEACRHPNDVSYLECEKCQADLSFIHPSMVNLEPPSEIPDELPKSRSTVRMAQLKLVSLKDGFEILIPWEGGLIGREGNLSPDYFASNLYISNEHTRIEFNEDGYTLVDRTSTNGTRLNGVKVDKGIKYPLRSGDRVVFANMEFIVQEIHV